MRTRANILILGSAIALSGSAIFTPAFSQAAATPEIAADEGLVDLKAELITSDTMKGLGFTSLTEASMAVVDKDFPLKAYIVELKDLRKFKKGDDVEKMLKDENIIVYPVTIDKRVRSSITVSGSKDGTWEVTGWGAPDFIEGLTTLVFEDSYLVVWLVELNIYFLGERQQNGKLMLASLSNRPEFKLERRVWKPASDVFLQFSKLLPTIKPAKPSNPANPREPG